jgi:type II secretory pathway pseudopilin PulG
MAPLTSARGFTLFETLVATGILVTTLAGLAQLFVLGAHLTRQASASGMALIAAQDKLEALRGLSFAYGDAGEAVTDPALRPSGSSTLEEDSPPYVDWLDSSGQAHDGEADVALVRRWRVSHAFNDANSLAIEVCVFTPPAEGVGPPGADACLSTIRTRQP